MNIDTRPQGITVAALQRLADALAGTGIELNKQLRPGATRTLAAFYQGEEWRLTYEGAACMWRVRTPGPQPTVTVHAIDVAARILDTAPTVS